MKSIPVIILLLGVHGAVSTGREPPKFEDPCQSSMFATEINWYCVNHVKEKDKCCESVIASVDIEGTGTAPCLCRVAAEPQLIMAGLNTDYLLEKFAWCGALALGGAPLEATCEGVADSPPPPRTELYQATTLQNSTSMKTLMGDSVATTACNPQNLAFQLNAFCSSGVISASCCKAVVSSVNFDNNAETPCICRVVDQWVFLNSGLGINDIIGLYGECKGRQGVHQLFNDIC